MTNEQGKSIKSLSQDVDKQDQLIEKLQEQLTKEKDGRNEDRFVGIVLLVLLLDVVAFR